MSEQADARQDDGNDAPDPSAGSDAAAALDGISSGADVAAAILHDQDTSRPEVFVRCRLCGGATELLCTREGQEYRHS